VTLRPRQFCRQSLEALWLDPQPAGGCERWALETLLRQFAREDVPPRTFERQLRLLIAPDLCPHLSCAAWRILECWRQHQRRHVAQQLAGRRN